jgi:DNA-binding NarL/FixJ family response regulator
MKPLRRVLLADDHAIVLEGLRRVLEPDFEIVGEVADGHALVAAAAVLRPDIIVTDISMPLLNGIEAARQIRKIDRRVKIIFLTMHPDVTYAAEALGAGGSAYVLKSSAGAELLEAIGEALSGGKYVTPAIDREVVRAEVQRTGRQDDLPGELTPRQREVLQLLAEGKSLKEVAASLKISIKTAEFHKYRIMKQIGVRTNAEMTKYAVKLGVSTL